MDKSFSSWRKVDDTDSDDEENVSSKPLKNVLVFDSDEENQPEEVGPSSVSKLYVPDSDESLEGSLRSLISDSDKSKQPVIESDSDEPNSAIHDSMKNKTASSYRSSVIESDSDEPNSTIHESTKNKTASSYRSSVIESDSDEPNSAIHDSTKNKTASSHRSSLTESDSDKTDSAILDLKKNKTPSSLRPISRRPVIESDSDEQDSAIIDLTKNKTPSSFLNRRPVIESDSDEQDSSILTKNQVIHITSDSENEESLSHKNHKKTTVSSPQNLPEGVIEVKPKAETSQKFMNNDYSSRLDSLKAEQIKLDAQVKEVLKQIDTVKNTLRTANLAVLPDKGVRLQMNLKKYETQLRDLRYQQNTNNNEIIRLQLMSSKDGVPKPIQVQTPQQKMYKLATTTTDINAMGKRALETHRTQQALTVDALKILHNSLQNCPSEDTLATDPDGLKVELMPHQKYALSWLLWREREKPSGGILADDMGLGKTLTMISLILKSNEEKKETSQSDDSESDEAEKSSSSNWLSRHRQKLIPGRTLVICPASLVGQWENEAQRRVKRGIIDVLLHHGQSRETRARRLAKHDLVITTYNIVSRDNENAESPLFQIKWERIILDEAHQIRNHKTKTAQAVFRLKARSRWALTGTPVHNKELDLYAQLKFLRCSPFDDLGVWKTWVDNRNVAGKQRMNTIIKSIMLRRTKAGLQEIGELRNLPNKNFNIVSVKMDKDEWRAYEQILNFSKALFSKFLLQQAEKENALQGNIYGKKLQHAEDPFKEHPELARLHRQMKEISDVKSHHILMLLLRLRQFCCHPSLITAMLEKDDISTGGIEDTNGLDIDLVEKMTRMSIAFQDNTSTENSSDLTVMDKDNPLFSKNRISSKLKKVMETVQDILVTDDKLLIVSQWVSFLDIIHSMLEEKNVKCLRLTGQVAVKDRADIVDRFNTKNHGPRVLLLSLTAGGVGLNLVGANHLLLLDLHWNPQLENQACDRIYRVGQEKDVQIYKFVTSDAVEETVLQLQEKKIEIADSVLTGARQASSKLTLNDLKMLFQVS